MVAVARLCLAHVRSGVGSAIKPVTLHMLRCATSVTLIMPRWHDACLSVQVMIKHAFVRCLFSLFTGQLPYTGPQEHSSEQPQWGLGPALYPTDQHQLVDILVVQ